MATGLHNSPPSEEESCLGEHAGSTFKQRHLKILPSWKLGVSGWTCLAALVLALNVGLSSYVDTHYGYSGGLGSLMTGKCTDVRKAGVIAHLFINVLSTLLLSGCNYCMQCLSAPSRREVDQAHATARALDIGIPTIRNFHSIDRRKTAMWCLLGLSSLPLHLLYNSVVYSSISANNYMVFSVNKAFIQPGTINASALLQPLLNTIPVGEDSPAEVASQLHLAAAVGGLQLLDKSACITAYANDYLSDRSNLLLVLTDAANNSSEPGILAYGFDDNDAVDRKGTCVNDPYPWICPTQDCNSRCQDRLSEVLAQSSTWKPLGQDIDYCLSQSTTEECKLHFSLVLAIVVIVFNVCQVLLMLILALGVREDRMLTIGDAAASFLSKPDRTTQGCCIHRSSNFGGLSPESQAKGFGPSGPTWLPLGMPWERKRARFSENCSSGRWAMCYLLYSIAIITCLGLLLYGKSQILGGNSIGRLFGLGLGTLTPDTIIYWGLPSSGSSGFATSTIVANIPQLVLSLVHFTYNALFTSMLAGLEWSKFAWQRRGLRVSGIPSGAQRSTYFLQLPYRYALPLLLFSGTIQWLVSQGLFLVAIERYDPLGEPAGYDKTDCDYGMGYRCNSSNAHYTCAWSPLAIFTVIFAGIFMISAAFFTGRRRYRAGIPLGGTNSAVISAACHADEKTEGDHLELSELTWGVVPSSNAELGHCALSSREVSFPQAGHIYM